MEANLEQVAANAIQLNAEDRTQLLRLFGYFEDLFDDNLGYWDTDIVNLEINRYSKPFNCKYYLVLKMNKETFRKELQFILKIGLLTTVQHSQYGTPVITITKKEGTVRFIMDYCSLNQILVRKPYS